MSLKILFSSTMGLLISYMAVSQYTCTEISVCGEDSPVRETVLSVKSYNAVGLLIKDQNNTGTYNGQFPNYKTYRYNNSNDLVFEMDSNAFQKIEKTYHYKNGKIEKVIWIDAKLSTENISRETPFPLSPMDTVVAYQPKIVYVWNIDTIFCTYQYNSKGLLMKITKRSTAQLIESSEQFEYDEKNRISRSFESDRNMYRYYYDGKSNLIKKETYNNNYIDDSGIGPDLKPESTRLKNAQWKLAYTTLMTYNDKGQLLDKTDSMGDLYYYKEVYSYNEDGKLKEIRTHQEALDAYFPDCKITYQYK